VVTDGDGGPTDFIHTERLVLVDKQKRIRGYYDGTDEKEVKQLIRDIKKLKNEN
jgi:protein SCO1/2